MHPLLRAALCAGIAAGLAAGCTETIHSRGNMPDPEVVAQITPGKQTRSDVTRLLGTPSTIATFEREVWLYIGGRVKSKSFFTPEILERKIVAIEFDKSGIVSEVLNHDASKVKNIKLVERETPTKGKEMTVLQQLVGNVGRFGKLKKKSEEGY